MQPLTTIVRSVLEACPGVQIVLTSRIPLDVDGESLVPVEPLGYPAEDAGLVAMGSAPAVQFLARRLLDGVVVATGIRRRPGCWRRRRRVDGLPLGLELAAGQAAGREAFSELAHTGSMTPLDLAAALRPRKCVNRTLRETLVWSTDRLDPAHRRACRPLSVFVGRFDLPAARAVAGGVDAAGGQEIDGDRALARPGGADPSVERASTTRLELPVAPDGAGSDARGIQRR